MKSNHKGYEIEVTREESMAGYEMLFYSIFRESDGYECLTDFEDSAETINGMINNLKERIDNELKSSDPWGESEESIN